MGHTFSPFIGFHGGKGVATTAGAFAGTLAVNTAIWLVLTLLVSERNDRSDFAYTAFFLLLISLVVSLFDYYRPVAPRFDDPSADLPAAAVIAPG